MTPRRPIRSNKTLTCRRGIALILVLLVMAVASILAFAMLSASALQAEAGSNAITAAAAQAQAESGIRLAAYYLTHPDTAPVSAGNWTSAGISFVSTAPPITMPGSVTVTVSSTGSQNYYNVTAVGSVPTSTDGQQITRQITAQLEVVPSYQITGAGASNVTPTLTIGSGVIFDGSISTSASVNITGSGVVTGNVSASSFLGNAPEGQELSAPSAPPAPTAGTVTDYSQPYYYQGTVYYPVNVGNTVTTSESLGPTPGNPLGIFYCSGNLTVSAALSVTGTLYVDGGTLIDQSSVTINPVSLAQLTYSLPALVVDKSLEMKGANRTFTANGVVCTNSGITNATPSNTTTVNITGRCSSRARPATSSMGRIKSPSPTTPVIRMSLISSRIHRRPSRSFHGASEPNN